MRNITEGRKSDISTVYAYYTEAYLNSLLEPGVGRYGKLEKPRCDYWSCFNDEYKRGAEREFIETIADDSKYSSYHISWDNCN